MRRFRLVPHGGQNGARPGFRAIQHRECALGALEDRFCLPGRCVRIGGHTRAQGADPSVMEALGVRNGQLPLGSRCLPPPSQIPMCGNQPVREPRLLGESGRAYREARASPTCTNPRGRRFRHFGGRHRISCCRVRSPVGPRRPGPHGGLCGVVISILCSLGQALYRSASGRVSFEGAFTRGGIHPTPTCTCRGRACRGSLASLGGPIERLGRLRSMPTPSELDFGIFGR